MRFELQDSLIKNEESANDTMQHLMDHIRMPISNETNASEVANNLTAQLNESVRIAFFVFNVSLFNNVDSFVRKVTVVLCCQFYLFIADHLFIFLHFRHEFITSRKCLCVYRQIASLFARLEAILNYQIISRHGILIGERYYLSTLCKFDNFRRGII